MCLKNSKSPTLSAYLIVVVAIQHHKKASYTIPVLIEELVEVTGAHPVPYLNI